MDRLWSSIKHAAIVWANYAQFSPGMRYCSPKVETRMMVWCVNGTGKICADGKDYDVTPGRFFLLRWQHSISYEAAAKNPFLLGGLHVVPWVDPHAALVFKVSHRPDSALAGIRTRHDVPCPELRDSFCGDLNDHPILARQAEYVAGLFASGVRQEAVARALGPLVLWQWVQAVKQPAHPTMPVELAAILCHIRMRNLPSLSIKQMAQLGQLSASSVIRLFRRHFNTTPRQWLLNRQLDHAQRLLLSSNLRVGEVAREVGMDNVYYFSRWFKERTGVPPRIYRQQNRSVLI